MCEVRTLATPRYPFMHREKIGHLKGFEAALLWIEERYQIVVSVVSNVLIVGSYNAWPTAYCTRLPRPGETVMSHHFENGPGGKGANQAIGAKRLGADVAFICKLGADAAGEEARAILLAEGLPHWGLLAANGPTGVALIMVGADGENMIAVAPGGNLELSSREVLDLGREVDDARIVLLQLECEAALAAEMGAWASQAGIRAVLNPAPVRNLSLDMLANFEVITPNEGELVGLAEVSGVEGATLQELAEGMVKGGVRNVVVTLGHRGAMWVCSGGSREFSPYRADVVDTTGAGDAFNAGLVAALADGQSMEVAIDQGCRAGAYCVTRPGVIDGLGDSAQLAAMRR